MRFDRREATAADVQELLNHAAVIDRLMQRDIRDAAILRHWTNLGADLTQLTNVFNLTWPSITESFPDTNHPNNDPVRYSSSLLTGTYRLDPSNSDDPGQAADKATQALPYSDRARLRDQLAGRLESPDQIALELRGRDVTIGSSRAPQISFSADGTERIERKRRSYYSRPRVTEWRSIDCELSWRSGY
jgi:hypothetical protein